MNVIMMVLTARHNARMAVMKPSLVVLSPSVCFCGTWDPFPVSDGCDVLLNDVVAEVFDADVCRESRKVNK